MRAFLQRLKQALCAHQFRIDDIRRLNPHQVECACKKCGKVVSAPYGIALPGRLTQ